MVFECQNCGAPLDVRGDQQVVRCAYCGRSSIPEQLQLIHQQTPPGWAPPRQWTPPAEFPADSSQTLYYRAQRTVVLMSVVGTLVCGITGLVAALNAFGPRSTPPEPLSNPACPYDFDSARELECECRPGDMTGRKLQDLRRGPARRGDGERRRRSWLAGEAGLRVKLACG
jgi:hypothetical protein